ncbi:hypothetical protein [Leptolyngbya sp. FACHB-261]|uniref:hypothetical protein n=1 Tax=Leptolyngbya sp. FACHB-261 TaxID=2692806 RepID=UPI001683510E|nr:hypothetical protein [Leptolyngbya sp. FACHB-261]MBD2100317.1 hypothetical protein [Leptolyngbya sp. FACHB-261]
MELPAATDWSWLENSVLATVIRDWIWLYPLVETVHILALAILFGTVTMFDLRLLGFSHHLLVTDLVQFLLPWAYLSFGIAVLSGLLLFAVDATEIAVNPAFRWKLLLMTGAGINAASFHAGPFRSVKRWNRGIRVPTIVQIIAGLSLILWTGVIICGRMIAYV